MNGKTESHIDWRDGCKMTHLLRDLPYDIVPQYWLLGLNGERLGRLVCVSNTVSHNVIILLLNQNVFVSLTPRR